MRDLRSIGVTEKINKNNAFKMLRSLCQAVRALGYTGLALLFDEGDRMLSVGGRSEKVATDNLREVIDRCREDLPGALFMYAVPPAFINDIVPKYPALQQRVQSPDYFSRANPFSPQISLDHLDIPDEQLLAADRLAAAADLRGWPMAVKLDPDMQAANIAVLAEAALDLVPGDQPPPPVHQGAGDRMVPPERGGRQRISAEYAAAAITWPERRLDAARRQRAAAVLMPKQATEYAHVAS